MKIYTVHLDEDAPPVLVREGFAWGALIFGPLWLAAHRAWLPAALSLLPIVACAFLPGRLGAAAAILLAIAFGLFGHDLRRWALSLRGRHAVHVIAAPSEEAAFIRLLAARPDLAAQAAP